MPPRGARGRTAAAAAPPLGVADAMAAFLGAAISQDHDALPRAALALESLVEGGALAAAGGDAALDVFADALASPSNTAVARGLHAATAVARSRAGARMWPLLAHPRVPGALAALLCDPARWRLHGVVISAVYWVAACAPAAAVAAIEERGAARGVEALEAAVAGAAASMCADNGQAVGEAAAALQARSPLMGVTQEASSDPLDLACGALLRLALLIPGGLAAARRRLLAHPRLLGALAAAAAAPGAAGPPAALVSGAGLDVLSALCGWNPDGRVRYDGTADEALHAAPGLPLAAGRLLAAARARGDDTLAHVLLLLNLLTAAPPADARVALAGDGGALRALQGCLAPTQPAALRERERCAAEYRREAAAKVLSLLAEGAVEAAGSISRAPGMLAALLQLAAASPIGDLPAGQPALRANAASLAARALAACVAAGGPPARRQLLGLMAAAPRLAAGLGDALRLAPAACFFYACLGAPQESASQGRLRTRRWYALLAAAIITEREPEDAPGEEATPVPEALSRCARFGGVRRSFGAGHCVRVLVYTSTRMRARNACVRACNRAAHVRTCLGMCVYCFFGCVFVCVCVCVCVCSS
jgi:hypothetical protein